MSELPNIIWLIDDDLDLRTMGCYGGLARTPHLDQLAQEGMRFEQTFATAPSCAPSRASMYTGCYPHTVGMGDHDLPLNEGVNILPSYLREQGYWSAHFAKLHLGPRGHDQFDRNFKKYEEFDAFVRERPRHRPFFLSFGFNEPHRRYDPNDPKNCGFEKGRIPNPHQPQAVRVPAYLPDVPPVREELAAYYDHITYLDTWVGRITNWLEDEDLAANTLVLFFGDHGPPFPRAKTTLYDSGINVPLIARWPGVIPAGSVQRGQFSLVDLTPTMLEIAGISPSTDLHGQSRWGMLTDPNAAGCSHVLAQRNFHCIDDHIRCIRTERFKYIRNYYPDEPFGHPEDLVRSESYQAMLKLMDAGELKKEHMLIFRCPRPVEELYDLAVDPQEFSNLVHKPEYQDELLALRKRLDSWIAKTNDLDPGIRMRNRIDLRTGEAYYTYPPVPRTKERNRT
ncbi:MAG: sulfatase [Anaerolineales bacterium]|jgi:arylsulfatase A-like enzyme